MGAIIHILADGTGAIEFNLDEQWKLIAGCNCCDTAKECDEKDASNTHDKDCRRSRPDRITGEQMFALWKKTFL